MELPSEFLKIIQEKLGNKTLRFQQALQEPVPVSIRLNPIKPNDVFANFEKVPWHPQGRYLPERPLFTLDPLFHAGTYYVQEASSMAIHQALIQCVDLEKKINVLDLCAAPGGKSTLLLSAISPESFLLANEVIKSRVAPLRQNLIKWGHTNFMVSNHDPIDFAGLNGFFDVVLIDAPCSGEGLFRKDPNAMKEWSLDQVGLCSARQKRILSTAHQLVKNGGLLVYSTCTYNDFENDQNVDWLLAQDKFELCPLEFPEDWGIEKTRFGYQFFPNRLKGEGFYLSVLKYRNGPSQSNGKQKLKSEWPFLSKQELKAVEPWIENPARFKFFQKPNFEIVAVPNDLEDNFLKVASQLNRRSFGLNIGQLKQKKLIPSHELTLSQAVNKNLPSIELDLEAALNFLRKENFSANTNDTGWHLVKYQGNNLGWVKLLGNRFNNYLPNEWRIKNL
ncbi:MAG: RNA methyltransferase [Saprospiraceae bacterium]